MSDMELVIFSGLLPVRLQCTLHKEMLHDADTR